MVANSGNTPAESVREGPQGHRSRITRWIFPIIVCSALAALAFWPRNSSVPLIKQTFAAQPAKMPIEWAWLKHSIKSWDAVQVPERPKTRAPEAGKKLYLKLCADCHGDTGKGNGPLAKHLNIRPRNFTKEWFRFRSVDGSGHAKPADIYRTISNGIPAAAMPSYKDLSATEIWQLVDFVESISATFQQADAAENAFNLKSLAAKTESSVANGQKLFTKLQCNKCHGDEAHGDGPSAAELKDDLDHPIKVPDLHRGRRATKSGGSAISFARALWTGLPGSPMPSFKSSFDLNTEAGLRQLSDLAYYLDSIVETGEQNRKKHWIAFFEHRRQWNKIKSEQDDPTKRERWDKAQSDKFTTAKTNGCTACHQGIHEAAEDLMGQSISAFAGYQKDKQCTVCHEGDHEANQKTRAHENMISNPGSLWVTSIGLGCAKCHSEPLYMSSLHGRELPEKVGGSLMSVVSTVSDPTGKSGGNHAYRMQRALMALEFGKVSHVAQSARLLKKDQFRFGDFDIDDTDGPTPSAGTESYKRFMAFAKSKGRIVQMEKGEHVPSYSETLKMMGPGHEANAGYMDYYRKDCGRCHLWSEGENSAGNHRSAGCSACHIVYNNYGLYKGNDPTIPKDKPSHMDKHQIVLSPPVDTCNKCHSRGQNTKRHELHTNAGMKCGDCHSSIDVHGDGNIYPSIPFQLETRCEDCHGTKDAYPWELPIGHGNGAELEGKRGVHEQNGKKYILTSRGNPRTNWRYFDGQVIVKALKGDGLWIAPLLKDGGFFEAERERLKKENKNLTFAKFRNPAQRHSQIHIEKMECYACHNTKAPKCLNCHIDYARDGSQVDYIQSGMRFNPKSTRQTYTLTKGRFAGGRYNQVVSRWLPPEIRPNRRDKLSPFITGCTVSLTHYSEDLKTITEMKVDSNPNGPRYPTGLAAALAHEWDAKPKSCADCHTSPDGKGKPAPAKPEKSKPKEESGQK